MSIRDERKQQSRQALLDAALTLSTSGRSFSSISLREVAREVGLVPTAFYRHFQDMDELGSELVDQVALYLKHVLHQLGKGLAQPEAKTKTKTNMELFFEAVDSSPQQWIFMIAERWGGSEVVRRAIAREIDFLNDDLANDLKKFEVIENFRDENNLKIITNILINLSFTWAMSWISLSRQDSSIERELQKMILKKQAVTQIRLIFKGIENWDIEK